MSRRILTFLTTFFIILLSALRISDFCVEPILGRFLPQKLSDILYVRVIKKIPFFILEGDFFFFFFYNNIKIFRHYPTIKEGLNVMGVSKKLLSTLIMLTIVFLQLVRFSSMTAEAQENDIIAAADGNGGCYTVENRSDSVKLTYYKRISSCTEKLNEETIAGFRADLCLADKYGAVLVGNGVSGLKLLEAKGGRFIDSYIDKVHITNNNVAISRYRNIYLLKEDSEKSIFRYNPSDNSSEEITAPETVSCLFTDHENDVVYAVCSNGIFDVVNGGFTKCEVPKPPIKFDNGYCTDTNGNVFDFIPGKGFEKAETDEKCTGTLGWQLLQVQNGKLYLTERDGEVKGALDLNNDTAVYPSGNAVALVSGNSVQLVTAADFKPITDNGQSGKAALQNINHNINTDSSDQKDKEGFISASVVQANSEPDQQSLPTEEKYKLSGGSMILVAQNTTVAQLKRAFGDKLTGMLDHNGRRVTSGKTGTGWRAEINSRETTASYTIIVRGDMTGEGEINNNDLKAFVNCFMGDITVSSAAKVSGDMNDDGIIDVLDIGLLHKLAG